MTDITLNSTLVRRLNHGKMSRALCLEAGDRINELEERIELALRLEQTDIVGFISEALRGRKFSELPKDVQDCLLEYEALEKPE